MPAYRFSWDAFSNDTVNAIVNRIGFIDQTASRREWLAERVKRPNLGIVARIKDVLEDNWLADYRGINKLVDRLRQAGIGPGHEPKNAVQCVDYIRRCRNSKAIQHLLLEALLRFGDVDRTDSGDNGYSDLLIPTMAVLDTKAQKVDAREPHPYQNEAWQALSSHFINNGSAGRGLLVMPTGSGKTFTAAHWLIRNVVNKGGLVLWLAHRYELLNQAAREFHRLAGYATKDRLRVRIVSGAHRPTSSIGPEDDIIVCSVWSLARRHDILDDLLKHRDVFLVVDEAHHAPAKSYRDIIERVGASTKPGILGLTATPTRTEDAERQVLSGLFGNNLVHEVGVRPLIEQQYLARPKPVRVPTAAKVERGVSQEDLTHLARFNELSEGWLNRIAHIPERNKVIVEHYLEDLYGPTRDPQRMGPRRYGKTLMYAINVLHAALLKEAFAAAEIESEYVTYYRPDGSSCDYGDAMARFAEPGSGLDILINVEMFTEGFDVPGVQTVFLTRPTGSEILLRQMIGRALRGRKVGGTDTAYIVSFEDHWDRFRDWESPIELILAEYIGPDEEPEEDEEDGVDIEAGEGGEIEPLPVVDTVPWDLIAKVARAIQVAAIEHKADSFEAIPYGWYVLEREVDGDGVRQIIHVYQHQVEGWKALMRDLSLLGGEGLESIDLAVLLFDYFDGPVVDWTDPDYDGKRPTGLLPADFDLAKAVEHFIDGGQAPRFHVFEERAECDPYAVAQHICDVDPPISAVEALIAERFESPLAKAVFRSEREFRAAVHDALYELRHPGEATRKAATPVFDDSWPAKKLDPQDPYDLRPLLDEVLVQRAAVFEAAGFEAGDVVPDVEIRWSRRPFRGFFARAFFSSKAGKGHIEVNKLLCSPGFSAESMKFLLWHEYLHIHLQQLHTPLFRDLERAWPGHVTADRELDTLRERFDLREAWHAQGSIQDNYTLD